MFNFYLGLPHMYYTRLHVHDFTKCTYILQDVHIFYKMYIYYTRCTYIIQDVHILYKMYIYYTRLYKMDRKYIRTFTVQEVHCTLLSKYLQCTGCTYDVGSSKKFQEYMLHVHIRCVLYRICMLCTLYCTGCFVYCTCTWILWFQENMSTWCTWICILNHYLTGSTSVR